MVVFGGADRGRVDLYEVWTLDLDPSSPTFEKWQNLTVEEDIHQGVWITRPPMTPRRIGW